METIRVPSTSGFSALPTGTVLDRYRIESVIAAGGFGITYLAQHVTLKKNYALKEHFPRQLAYREGTTSEIKPTDPETYSWALDRFVQEGQTLAQCHHPNVVSVADVFGANGTAYMALGYEQGQSFRSWLDALGRRPTQAELDAILTPLLGALEYVHGQGLLHRDIAPDNIMIRTDGSPCLIDFGAARQAVAERSQMMSAIVKSGFSPPEQYARSGRAQGPWSDIYALGATLYRAITGAVPPEATERVVHDELQPTSALVPPNVYRPAFLDAIDTSLRMRSAERPQTVAVWRGHLLTGNTTQEAAPPPPPQGTRQVTFTELPSQPATTQPPPSPRSRWKVAAGALVAVLIAGAAGWWLAPSSPDPRVAKWEAERKAAQELAAKEIAKAQEQLEASKALLKSQEEQRTRWAAERLGILRTRLAEATDIATLDQIAANAPDLRSEVEKRKAELIAREQPEREANARAQRAAAERAEEERRKHEAEARARAAADAKRKAEEADRSRDPVRALVPGSGQSARDRLKDGSECVFCPEMVVVPAGTFRMGSPENEPERDGNETQISVRIARPFAVGTFAVTFDEWDACAADRGCNGYRPDDNGWGRGKRPVINVNWDDAKSYAAWLSRKTGRTYRLPSDAEREYFTRAGTTTPYWWGWPTTPTQGNYNGSQTYIGGGRTGEFRRRTVTVDTFTPNPWGLYQVHGNVWEWTEDCWNASNTGNPGNGNARTAGDCSDRVIRGGSWYVAPRQLRSASRYWATTSFRVPILGFRLARMITP